MKIKYFLALFFLNVTIQAQQKIEIFFDFDKYEINSDSQIKLLDWIVQTKDIEVQKIYGYCDWKGSNSYNDSLSIKRVQSVYDFLKGRRIQIKDDYETKGFGEDFEQSKVQSENRKVTIVYDKIKVVIPKTAEALDLEEMSNKIKTAKPGDLIRLKNINFYNYSAKLVPKSKPILYELLCIMNDNPKLKIEIQGHICCQTEVDKYDVSYARARAIYVFLVQNKINRKRLTFKGYGITRPIHPIPEKNEAEADENRRVEIMIVEN
ncbi:MAG: OmpA family protein [Bacteroidota bacterium]